MTIDINTLSDEIKQRESIIDSMVPLSSTFVNTYLDTTLLIARGWNSWTPSFFNVPGGCYAIVPPMSHKKKSVSSRGNIAIIDPGFGFLNVLKDIYNIGVMDIKTVIVSHNHPDHVGGILKYIALEHTYNKQKPEPENASREVKFLLNESCHRMLDCLRDHYKLYRIRESKNIYNILKDEDRWDGNLEHISFKAIETFHSEIGNTDYSVGLLIDILTKPISAPGNPLSVKSRKHSLAILGDTEYRDDYAKTLLPSEVIVLHLGSFQVKEESGKGKHLYANGLLKILDDMKQLFFSKQEVSKKYIIISEVGLEHASNEYINSNAPSELSGLLNSAPNSNYKEDIEQYLREIHGDWAHIYVAKIDTTVTFGDNIVVRPGESY